MCADRFSPKPALVDDSVAFDDLTLSGAGDARMRAVGFPDSVQDAHLVLYQSADGGVELRWHLDATALAHARRAFGDGPEMPSPVLRLRQLGDEAGGAASRVIAEAALTDRHMVADGFARYAAGAATGLLQAEIGLSTGAGGWVLVARSNRLQAIAPVGASFLRAKPGVAAAASMGPELESASEPEAEAESESGLGPESESERAPITPPSPPWQARQTSSALIPDFPLVQPSPGRSTTPERALPRDIAAADGSSGVSGQFDPSLASLGPSLSVIVSGSPEISHPAEKASAAQPPASMPDPLRENVPKQVPEQASADTAAAPNAAPPNGTSPIAGSGPLRRFSVGTANEITAELLVQGRAAPGMLLDLGGHAYRVGAGGRFAFRVPLYDRELIMRLLASVPTLPVESRVGDTEPGEQQGD